MMHKEVGVMAPESSDGRDTRPGRRLQLASSQTLTDTDRRDVDGVGDEFWWLVELTSEGITIQQDDRIVYANDVAAKQHGAADPKEIVGRDEVDFVAEADRQQISEHIQQLLVAGGRSERLSFQRLRLDQSVLDVEAIILKISWQGKPAILSMICDVSIATQADTRLQEFLSTATHWLWETDADHRFTYVSDFNQGDLVTEQILGKTRWELGGVEPGCNAHWKAHVADLEARRPFRDFEYRSTAAAWCQRYLSISGMPVFDVHGVFKGYRGTTRDITRRKQAEHDLRDSDQRFKLALEGAKGGVFDMDLVSGEVIYDDQSARMLGYDEASEVPSQISDWMNRLHPDDREAARNRLDQFLEGKTEILRSEQRQRTKSGKWVWFNCIGKIAERDDEGRPRRLVGLRFDITERKRAEQTIAHMALHDALTTLPNRVYFKGELERSFNAADREGRKLAVLFLDLDHFKNVNDTLGHPVGDKLLVEVASRLKSCLRGGDLVARFGGDEFVMVVTQPYDPASISYLAERITKMIAMPYDIDGSSVDTSISIGIAIYPDDGGDADRILANADLALYTAKRAGRHTWRVFDSRLQEQLQAQRSLDQELRLAVDRQQFELHYQPLVRIADDEIVGFEALVRWNHPERGQIQPDRFIPATEQNRLIIPLTEWILAEATAQLQRWTSRGLCNHKVAVNISPILLKLQGFIDLFDRCIDSAGCDPKRLVIEITEGMLIDETKAVPVLTALQDRGVTIAVDDFGMGYSSMVRLKNLPVDTLKIDRSFLVNVTDDLGDASIVKSLVNVGHSLGKKVVAEGVETDGQLEFLKKVGCDVAQGFFINRPMTAADIPAWSSQWQSSRSSDGRKVGSGQPKRH